MIANIGRKLLFSTKCPTKFQSKKYSVTFIRKVKPTFFGNINITDAKDKKIFWRTVKPSSWIKLRLVTHYSLLESDVKVYVRVVLLVFY